MSSSCGATRLSLGAYALGSLEPADQHEVEAHLAACPMCLTELAEFESVVPRLAMLSPQDVSPSAPSADLFARITDAVDSAEAQQPVSILPRRWSTRWLVAVAASVLVVIGAGTAVGIAVSSSRSAPAATSASATAGGVHLQVKATDAGSGTRLELTALGLPRQEHCHLVAFAADGTQHDAGTWDATYDGKAQVIETTDVVRAKLRRLTLYGNDGRELVAVGL